MTEPKEKSVHWTKRPENKAKLAKMVRKSVAAKKAARTERKKSGAHKPKPKPQPKPHDGVPEEVFAYALGHTECWLDAFAKSAGVSPEALASRLGQVLHSKVRR